MFWIYSLYEDYKHRYTLLADWYMFWIYSL